MHPSRSLAGGLAVALLCISLVTAALAGPPEPLVARASTASLAPGAASSTGPGDRPRPPGHAPGPPDGVGPPTSSDPDPDPTPEPDHTPDPDPWTPGPFLHDVVVTNDVPITMSDGRVLRAAIHHPAHPGTTEPASGPFPVVLWLTPYGKQTANPVNGNLVRRGYIGIAVDVAGTGGSDGHFDLFPPQEARDSVEIIEWAAGLPTSNGRVGMSGGSYLGIVQLFAAAEVGPGSPLKAIFPIVAAADPYRDLFVSGGIVNAESSLGLFAMYGGVRTATPLNERGWNDPIDAGRLSAEHGAQMVAFEGRIATDVLLEGDRRFDGPWWQARAPERVLQQAVDNGVAVYLVGGLFDVFQRGTPLLYSGLQNAWAGRDIHAPMAADQPVSGNYQVLFGPWHHGNAGAGLPLGDIELKWFDHWLKDANTDITHTTTPFHVVEPGGTAYRLGAYPAEDGEIVRLHADVGRQLVPKASTSTSSDTIAFTGLTNPCTRSTQQWSAGIIPPELCGDQQWAPRPYPGEVSWTTPPLETPLRLAGPATMTLHATSTRPEVMLVVTIESVPPTGPAVELSGGALLGSMRAVDPARSWATPGGDAFVLPRHLLTSGAQEPVRPGELTRYDVEIRPIFATIPAGHRLRVTVGSGDVPHLFPPVTAIPNLVGGLYDLHHGQSWLDLTVRDAG